MVLTLTQTALAVASGSVVGLSLGLVGGGGSILAVPLLVYVVGLENRSAFNRIYAEIFDDAKPARTVLPLQQLSGDHLIQIEAIAVRDVPSEKARARPRPRL